MLEAEEWRIEEIKQAKLALECCHTRGDFVAHEIRSLAHDVVSAGHDRDYRSIAVFFRYLLTMHQFNVRVFDLRTRNAGGYELRVSFFQTPGGGDWPIVDLLAFRHHMRWLKLCPDILSTAKRDWESFPRAHLQVFSVE